MQPHVKFQTNIDLDIQMTSQFLGLSIGGISFDDSIYGPNPDLKDVDVKDEQALTAYFENKYQKLMPTLIAKVEEYQDIWDKIENDYFAHIQKVFHDAEFPAGRYIADLSINDCNPRFLEDKTFQVFYQTKTPTRTVSHELTHFIFYDYTAAKFPELFADQDPNSGVYWKLAELFNNVILSQPEFKKLFNSTGDEAYPEHTLDYLELATLWEQTHDIDIFIPAAFAQLNR